MRGTEIEAIGELAGEALAAGGGLIKQMHEGIAGRPFGVLGPAAAPVRVVHDGVSRAVYGGVRSALRSGARGGASLLARRSGEDGPALAASPAGSLALGAINGLYGNHLTERGNRLAFGMAVRRHRDDVVLTDARASRRRSRTRRRASRSSCTACSATRTPGGCSRCAARAPNAAPTASDCRTS